jgi:transcriptional regulator with XRE-family HTH domain
MPYLEHQKEYIAKTIKEARLKKGLTQLQLALEIGTTQSMIAKIERETYGEWSYKILCKIATALDMIMEIKFMDVNAHG